MRGSNLIFVCVFLHSGTLFTGKGEKKERKSNIHSSGPTKAWYICRLVTAFAFALYFFYFAARWRCSRKSCSHTRSASCHSAAVQLHGFITGMCCQVIRPDPCKNRCGKIFFFYEPKKEPEVEKVEVKKGDWETWGIQFKPPPARWYSVPQCDRGRLRSVQIKENAMMWNVAMKKLSLRRWRNFDRIGWIAEREPRRIVSAPPKPLSAQLRMRFADCVVSCDWSWSTARRRNAHLQVWMHWWCRLVQEGQTALCSLVPFLAFTNHK